MRISFICPAFNIQCLRSCSLFRLLSVNYHHNPFAHFLFPSIKNRLLEHFSFFSFFDFPERYSEYLGTEPTPFLPSLMIGHRLVSLACVFSLTIDLLGRETPCKRHTLVLSLTALIFTVALMQNSSTKMALGPFTFKKYASKKRGIPISGGPLSLPAILSRHNYLHKRHFSFLSF